MNISRGRFIRFGATLGASVAGATVLAACGGGGGDKKEGDVEETKGDVGGAPEASEGGETVAQVE
ncbi:MAG: hypothetical protein M3117_06510, partial [Actinomycetota bacterium]|nr:hypothetical protein [Actinomycetota bacterium]